MYKTNGLIDGAMAIDRRMLIAYIKHPGQKYDYICTAALTDQSAVDHTGQPTLSRAIVSSLRALPCSDNQGGSVL